jgi:hypothetical protein
MVINVNGERPPHGGELRQAAGAAMPSGTKAFVLSGRHTSRLDNDLMTY